MKDKDISRFLSLILRHKPEEIGIRLDAHGWVEVKTLLQALQKHGRTIDRQKLEEIVAENNKQRFAFDETGTRIRANQGHSVAIDLDLPASVPPDYLFHGTAESFISSIQKTGLQKQTRQHVHLSTNRDTATQVGSRHGKPCILVVRAGKMQEAGFQFYISDNGVWLTDHVPVEFIDF